VTAEALATADLPGELVQLARPLEGGLPVGAPGKVGTLRLALARRNGTTRVEHHYQRAPLHTYQPIHLDPNLPEMAFVFVQQFGDGFVDGDRCWIRIDCGPDAMVHVTTQAATNLYRAERNFAAQLVDLRVGPRAVIEYLPDPVVPFRGSRFFQRTRVTADPDSTAILAEVLLPGRVARGEMHAYGLYRAEVEAYRPDGTLLFVDTLRLCPSEFEGRQSLALLGSSDVVATLHVIAQQSTHEELVELLRRSTTGGDVLIGVSELPNRCGVSARFLGPTSKAVRAALKDAWNAARLRLLDAPVPDLRKGMR
jgi:urease accessory protein